MECYSDMNILSIFYIWEIMIPRNLTYIFFIFRKEMEVSSFKKLSNLTFFQAYLCLPTDTSS
jgi:hypothetical protein